MNDSFLNLINHIGFDLQTGLHVQGRLSIADLFPKSKSRCGIYCFRKSGDAFYIGQSADVVKRFAQHSKNHDNIEDIWFISLPKDRLDEEEMNIIGVAERSGLPLINKSLVSQVQGETDFDYLIGRVEQDDWLAGHEASHHLDPAPADVKLRFRYAEKFSQITRKPQYATIRSILRRFINDTIPYPRTTEMSFWAITCLPDTNKAHYPRFFCLNINFMEVLVAGWIPRSQEIWAFLNTSCECLEQCPESISKVQEACKSISYDPESWYRAAGHDQIHLLVEGLEDLEALVSEPSIVKASREFNLRLMRKGATIYSRYHCYDLVDDVLG